ncbi:Gfo/Idh/MocA family protein [Streptomyces sp. NPDC058000]|uniref:Gfo/Idh/MocA family protein n=1 Tax=Streptomyces sp. NPDC058000 TaxID=3346299 RepID=UPI0036E3FAD9
MRIALLGTNFGQAHAAVYAARQDVEVVMFGRDPARTAEIAGRFGHVASTDLDSAFAGDDFDLVDICLPIALHAQTAVRALEAGRHVLVELPLAGDLDDARRVIAARDRADRQVFVDMFERFIPANRVLFETVRDGAYGRLEQLTLHNRTAHLWPGASLGLRALPLEALHSDLDIITRLLGTPTDVAVRALARDADSATVEVSLAFEDTALARTEVSSLMPMSWGARGGWTATFTHGVLDSTGTMGFDGKPTGTLTAHTPDGARELTLPPADQYTALIEHVLACLRGQETNEIPPESTLDALALTLDVHHRVNGPR